jgi:hypothetical protein
MRFFQVGRMLHCAKDRGRAGCGNFVVAGAGAAQ